MAEQTSEREEEDVFDVGQDRKADEPFAYDEEALNLVETFKAHQEGRRALKSISEFCLTEFKNAWDATEQRRKQDAEAWKLFAGTLDPKGPQFKDLSNSHVPILMENIQRMTARQSHELFGNWTNVFGVTPIGPDDENTAKLLALHGNWQLRKRIPDFKRQMHKGLLAFALFGDVTCHSFWDDERRCNRHEMLLTSDFVCANSHSSMMPDYSDVEWVAKLVRMSAHQLRKKKKRSGWEDVDLVLKRQPIEYDESDADNPLREAVDKTMGVDQGSYQRGQYELVQFEGWLNLPPSTETGPDGEKRETADRYCQVIIDRGTRVIVSLSIFERTDPYDKRRFEFEMQQLQRWQAAMQEQQAFMQEREAAKMSAIALAHELPPDGDGPAQAVAMALSVEEMQPPPMPPMPDWMQGDPQAQPRPPETMPIRMFTHFVNIEPMQGILGLGTGAILVPHNKAANIALSMFFDQGALANFKQFLATGNSRLPDRLEVAPGKVHKLEGVTDLAKEIMPLDFGEANPQLLSLIEMFSRFGNSVSNTPEVLSGEPGKSGETMGGISARIEQATKMLSVPTGKFADALTNVLVNNAILNSIFLEDSEFFSVNNHDPMLGQIGRQRFEVGREMYDRPYDVEISADLKFTSTQQRISEADALVQLPNAVPAMATNYAFIFEAVRKAFEVRNRYDMVALMGKPPQPPEFFGMPSSPPAPPPGMSPPPGAPPAQGPPQQQPAPQGGP